MCRPLVEAVVKLVPELSTCLEQMKDNLRKWQDISTEEEQQSHSSNMGHDSGSRV